MLEGLPCGGFTMDQPRLNCWRSNHRKRVTGCKGSQDLTCGYRSVRLSIERRPTWGGGGKASVKKEDGKLWKVFLGWTSEGWEGRKEGDIRRGRGGNQKNKKESKFLCPWFPRCQWGIAGKKKKKSHAGKGTGGVANIGIFSHFQWPFPGVGRGRPARR